MPEQFNSIVFRGQGKFLLGTRDAAGKPVNLKFLGDCSAAKITPSVSRGKHIESTTGGRGVLASWINSVESAVALTLHSIRKDHLALILQGLATSKVGATVTDESHTANLDAMILLEHSKVSAVTVTHLSGTPTYVADTDYVLHADEGFIEPLSTGSITEAENVLIDYTYAAQDHVTTDPDNTEYYCVFAGKNTAAGGKQVRSEMYKVKFDPGALDLINTEAAAIPLNGTIEQDTLRPAGDQYFSYKMEA